MKILFLTSSNPDNLEDAILHGLRTIYGAECIDYPKKEVLYRNFSARPHTELYGNLFTLWRTLDDIPVDRTYQFRWCVTREAVCGDTVSVEQQALP